MLQSKPSSTFDWQRGQCRWWRMAAVRDWQLSTAHCRNVQWLSAICCVRRRAGEAVLCTAACSLVGNKDTHVFTYIATHARYHHGCAGSGERCNSPRRTGRPDGRCFGSSRQWSLTCQTFRGGRSHICPPAARVTAIGSRWVSLVARVVHGHWRVLCFRNGHRRHGLCLRCSRGACLCAGRLHRQKGRCHWRTGVLSRRACLPRAGWWNVGEAHIRSVHRDSRPGRTRRKKRRQERQ